MVTFIISDKLIKIRIHGRNREKYESIVGRKLKNGDFIEIPQRQVLEGTRVKVKCICDNCGVKFYKQRSDIRVNTLCGSTCRNEWLKKNNPNPPKEKVKVNCNICNKEIYINESKYKKQKNFLCSRDCYKKHRSLNYSGENTYNYNSTTVKCEMCNKKFLATPYDINSRRFLFCSPQCYWMHREEFYVEYYHCYDINGKRIETVPEKIIREWLSNNKIKFEQEKPFLKYFIDFYLTDYDIGIEVYGDYWHVNPKIYGDLPGLTPLSRQQIGTQEYDEKRNSEIRQHFPLFVIWESEIKDDVDSYMNKILNNIANRKSVTTARLTPIN